MIEEPAITQMNIDRYRAMLTQCLNAEQRSCVERLLAEANSQLQLASDLRKQ